MPSDDASLGAKARMALGFLGLSLCACGALGEDGSGLRSDEGAASGDAAPPADGAASEPVPSRAAEGHAYLEAMPPAPVPPIVDAQPPDVLADADYMPAPPSVHGAAFTDVTIAAGVVYQQGPAHAFPATDFYTAQGFVDAEQWFSGGAAAADYDGDGWVDLYVTRLDASDLLFRNRGDGTFENATEAAGLDEFVLASNGAGFADIDNDGDPDLYVTTLGESRFYLFINEGGTFSEEAIERGAAVEDAFWHGGYSVSFGDYDRDGWLDIHTTDLKWETGGPGRSHARLLHNLGADGFPGHFEDATVEAGVSVEAYFDDQWRTLAYTSTLSDLDADGWPDLLVASDYGTSRLFWNGGDGTFTDGTASSGVGTDDYGMGSAVGDYDGDGLLDWFVTSIYDYVVAIEQSGNRLYRNNGDRTFSDATDAAGVRDAGWGWGTAFFESDNDGDLDLVATNGYRGSTEPLYQPFLGDQTTLWLNDGSGVMTGAGSDSGIDDTDDGKGLLVFDYDRDGDQDIFIANHAGTPRLYRNDLGQDNDWLQVRLVGVTANRDGIGARLELQLDQDGPVQVRELRGGSNYLGQDEPLVQFGLGQHSGSIHRLEVVWPTPGGARVVQTLDDVTINQRLVVVEPD